mmetsp:Transcript_102244/g.187377  ORF Transcript_102244/g.187377 Transcript_102244/m.187377 type:complete len:229 (+) Transcript_102244:173-859(+)
MQVFPLHHDHLDLLHQIVERFLVVLVHQFDVFISIQFDVHVFVVVLGFAQVFVAFYHLVQLGLRGLVFCLQCVLLILPLLQQLLHDVTELSWLLFMKAIGIRKTEAPPSCHLQPIREHRHNDPCWPIDALLPFFSVEGHLFAEGSLSRLHLLLELAKESLYISADVHKSFLKVVVHRILFEFCGCFMQCLHHPLLRILEKPHREHLGIERPRLLPMQVIGLVHALFQL